jgi:Na+(H+)/acetate symporter ActP
MNLFPSLPAACLAFMMAATFSLSAACWEPVLVVLFFYKENQ